MSSLHRDALPSDIVHSLDVGFSTKCIGTTIRDAGNTGVPNPTLSNSRCIGSEVMAEDQICLSRSYMMVHLVDINFTGRYVSGVHIHFKLRPYIFFSHNREQYVMSFGSLICNNLFHNPPPFVH